MSAPKRKRLAIRIKIVEYMDSHGLTQKAMAARMRVGQSALSQVVRKCPITNKAAMSIRDGFMRLDDIKVVAKFPSPDDEASDTIAISKTVTAMLAMSDKDRSLVLELVGMLSR